MSVKWKTKKNLFPKIESSVKKIDGKKVNVGVLDNAEQAYIASIQEYGCTIRVTDKMRAYLARTGLHLKKSTTHIVIPERAFLRNGYDESIDEVLDKADSIVGNAIDGTITVETFFETIGLLLKGKIQDYAIELNSPPNHPYTVDHKGSSNPLVDSGDMIGAITYKVE